VDQISQIFLVQQGIGCSWSLAIQLFYSALCFRDICDQTRKLSEIEPNYDQFLPS